MNIFMQKAARKFDLSARNVQAGFVGQAVDERGNAAVNFVKELVGEANTYVVGYDPEELKVFVDGYEKDIEEFSDFVSGLANDGVIIDSTTLEFPEMYMVSKALVSADICRAFDVLYVEPKLYRKRPRRQLMNRRDFELSEEFPGFQPVPGATLMMGRAIDRVVFMLGFEERRLDRALNDHPMIKTSNCCVVFGVPAFCVGWEMNSFANNVRVIRDNNVSGGVYYSGAENPKRIFEILEQHYSALGAGERMFVAPLGTKPMAIGTALFLSEKGDVGALFDHPKNKLDRSHEVGKWHLFQVVE